MDNDMDRSVRLLEDALSPATKGLFKRELSLFRSTVTRSERRNIKDVEFSFTLEPHELQRVMDGNSIYDETMTGILQADKTMTGSIIQARAPWKAAADGLYTEFLDILQTYSGGHDVLEIVSDLARCCSDALQVVKGLQSKVAIRPSDEVEWLENERNTWRLLYILYQDRFHTQNLMEQGLVDQYFGISEKLCVENLYKRNSLLRESQLVVDWLESNAAERDDEVLHFSDSSVGWENTLHQLKSAKTIPFESSRQIVSEMHPDAPHHERLPLHDLDMQDEKKLCKKVFAEIRCGKLEEAQQICKNSGHAWRAALYEGWRLYHDPNVPENREYAMQVDKKAQLDGLLPEEGNRNRDIWKIMAFKYCKKDYLDLYEKASMAALTGYLDGILPVSDTWEDYLWAYMRVMIDICVESHIRDCVHHIYRELPIEYWEQRMSLNEIFEKLESSRSIRVVQESKKPDHIIQKYIILDEVPKLISALEEWVEDAQANTHFVRFAAHLALFLEQIGQANNRDSIESILEVYIKRLTDMNETQLVAFYTSKLGSVKQVQLYAVYLERIVDKDERLEALKFAEDCGMNVLACTKQVVENIRKRPHDTEEAGALQQKMTESDKFKISALDWVIFYESQRVEALIQTNALIFTFLTLGKLDAAQLAFAKIPPDSTQKILSEGNLSDEANQTIKEYLSYRIYLEGHEAFNEWFTHFKSQPVAPEDIADSAPFTEKVAHQHRVAQYKAEVERWKLTSSHLVKTAKTMLYNVLLFPDGWLVGAKDADYLRSLCIPEVVMLLYTVLFESEMHEECVQLADIIASEKHKLYKVYNKENLGELLTKLCESSVALLNAKKDPWGNDVTV